MRRFNYLIIILILLSIVGCSLQNSNDVEESAIIENQEGELSIAFQKNNREALLAKNIFLKNHEKTKIIDIELKTEDVGYKENLYTELMAGAGPDILIDENNLINSNAKFITSGIYYDLNKLTNKDDFFNSTDFYKDVLDIGVYNGKRYIVPYVFNIIGLVTTKDKLIKNNIEIDDEKWTWNEFAKLGERLKEDNKYIAEFFLSSYGGMAMTNFVAQDFIDFEKKKSYFNSKKYIEFLELYKYSIAPAISTLEKYDSFSGSWLDIVKQDNIMFWTCDDIAHMEKLQIYNEAIQDELKSELIVLPLPSLSEEQNGTFQVKKGIGITSKCKNKAEAFEYIKILLSEAVLRTGGKGGTILHGIPVNRHSYNYDKELFSNTDLYSKVFNKNMLLPLSKIQTERIEDLLKKSKVHSLDNDVLYNIIANKVKEFMDGQITAESAARDIDSKIMLYLNE